MKSLIFKSFLRSCGLKATRADRTRRRRLLGAGAMVVVGGVAVNAGAGESDCVTAEVLGVGMLGASSSPVIAIDVVGDFAYVLNIRRSLVVFDISDLSTPVIVGSISHGGFVAFNWKVRVVDGLAYLANGGDSEIPGGLKIFKVGSPENITLTGSFDIPGAKNIEVADSMAYIMNETSLVQFVSSSNPQLPELAGSYAASGEVRDVEVVDGVAHMLCDGSGLVTVDVTDPANPVLLGSFAMTGESHDIEVVGSVAYIANDDDGLVMIDVLDPAQPVLLGSFEIANGARRVSVSGDAAHLLSRGGLEFLPAFWSVDVSDPQSPALLGIYFDEERGMTDLKVRGETAFLSGGSGATAAMVILDVTNSCGVVCIADLTGDGALDFFDVSAFLMAFGDQDPTADFNSDGVIDFFDISAFLTAFGAGCP